VFKRFLAATKLAAEIGGEVLLDTETYVAARSAQGRLNDADSSGSGESRSAGARTLTRVRRYHDDKEGEDMGSRVRAGAPGFPRRWTSAGVAGLVVALALAASLVGGASGAQASHAKRTYEVSNLDSLGGNFAAGSSINNAGWVAGLSRLPGNAVQHATLWRFGSVTDLGTLGGPNSSVLWPVKNGQGAISGIAETGQPNPLGEIWSCGRFFPSATLQICRGFVWQDGEMRALSTLGGYNSFATGTNNHLQTVGWAETSVPGDDCVDTQVLRFHAVVWGPGENEIQDLPPLPGDTASAATAINDEGQVVGISGSCDRAFGRFSAKHSVLWENGVPINIGDLGGVAWNTPMAINRKGDIVGFANRSAADGGSFRPGAFLSTKPGKIEDLGALDDDPFSQALGINENRQVVGVSYSAGFARCRAFLWEHGVMIDLAELSPGYSDHLCAANDINDLGQITGEAVDATGASVPFLAKPVGPSSSNRLGAPSAARRAAPKLSWAALEPIMTRSGVRKEDLTR
jgi:probable HAF family extracellular repeat protein